MSAPAFVLTEAGYRAAERSWRRRQTGEQDLGELVATIERELQAVKLLKGDLNARDFSEYDETTLRNGITMGEHRLAELTRAAERLMPASGDGPRRQRIAGDYEARFAAAKLVDLVDLAQTLTGQEARKGAGGRHRIRCPFHDDARPSLVIYPPGSGWWCPVCHKGGQDAASFCAEFFDCTQVEGLRWVEELALGVRGAA